MFKKFPIHIIIISMIYVMLYYMSTVVDYKLVHLWIFEVPAPFLYFNFIYPLSDAVTEVYGPKVTWLYLITGFLITSFFVFLTVGIVQLPNPIGENFTVIQSHYNFLSQTMLKCLSFGYLAFFVGMYINVKLLSKWKLKYNGKYYYIRSFSASCISEAVVILLGQMLIWGTRLPVREVFYTIINGYPFIMGTTVLFSILGLGIKNLLFTIENQQSYVYNKDFFNKFMKENSAE